MGAGERVRRAWPAGRARLRLPARSRLPRWPRLPETRRGRRRAVQAAMALSVVALLPATWLRLTADSRVRTVADVPKAPVAVVFGAGLWDGEPSPYLAHRLDAAVELYERGKVRAILVTGDNSRHDYDEPDAMRAYLVRHGVPDGRIVSDYAGFDTWDSCSRAERIFGVRRAVLVSQDFHIRRALALCDAAGIDAYGVGVAEPHDVTWLFGGAREAFAAGKAALDAAFRPDPRFLGPREDGIRKALTGSR
ncbi:SanA/YdcF family protein [Streptomyces sparsogenes]|uniref:Integral membrane protein n=1 Tax=Streptomyces sparsogenes DSM 40356 TaxID=1331668 RepID=A0A1R1SIQ2_9ACTN|nr:ElyC/SanA/YdcF family protein [Streptomyces sparsogenes]OMI38182.1 integral membrane protein [Streptomyces sparsogenes DSM 40356]